MDIEIFFEGEKGVNARVRGHVVKTDQPTGGGGSDSAVTPFELFLASLGTCAGIYVKGFCDQRGISAEGIRITQSHEFDTRGMVKKVNIKIAVPEGFPEKYVESLIAVANLCKVKQHLAAPPQIEVTSGVAGK
jgi:ribosomal protein S12 methylthiotransferase accessory factor